VGAVTTATHGSGERNGNLATAVRALEVVTADGENRSFKRGEPDFEGAVVGLGALGIVTSITLDIEPTYQMRQDVFTGLPFSTLVASFDALTASAYSVSFFTSWSGDSVDQLWLKSRVDAGYTFDPAAYGATAADRRYHPIAAIGGEPCTEQGGLAGPWHERLPHFRFEFTPSNGEELQTEYFVPRRHAVDALTALRGIEERIAPHLLISEIRMIAADELWTSPNYREDCIGIHFTWKLDWPAVSAVLPEIEARLAPFEVRPHWGKLFTLAPAEVQKRYPRLGDFRRLLGEVDPGGKFRNDFVDRYIFG
jgi:alditol oxidase